MKKILTIILVFIICAFICACEGEESSIKLSDYVEDKTNLALQSNTVDEDSNIITNDDTDYSEYENTKSSKKATSKNASSSKSKSSTSSATKKSSSSKQSSSQSKANNKTDNNVILTGITVTHIGKKPKTGDDLKNSDFEVIAKYSDNTQKKVTDFSISLSKLQKIGNNTVTITYKNKSYSLTLKVLEDNAPNANPGGEFGYEIHNGELTITAYVGAKTDVVVPTWIDDMPVTAIKELSDKITSVVLPDSITEIKRHAFSGNNNLVSVTIGPNVVKMGDNIFYQCEKLKNVTIKTGATLIGDSMFSSCTSLESIVLPKTITTIEDNAFFYCENLKSIYIPSSVKKIGDYAVFSACYKLQSIIVEQNSYAQRWCLNNGFGEKLKYN